MGQFRMMVVHQISYFCYANKNKLLIKKSSVFRKLCFCNCCEFKNYKICIR